jgi:hypothetical protein
VLSPPSKKILKGDLKIGFTELALSMRLPQIVAEYVIEYPAVVLKLTCSTQS